MSKRKSSTNIKCQNYLNTRKRIKNATRKQEKRLKFSTMSEKAKANVIKSCRIGRKAEGISPESFKQKHSKNENNPNFKRNSESSR